MIDAVKRQLTPLLYVQSLWVLAIIVLVGAAFAIACPPGTFLTLFNFRNLLTDSAELIILTVGVTFVLISGSIDLSLGSVLVLTTVVTLRLVIAIEATVGVPAALIIGTAVAIAFGGLCGWVNGMLVAKAKIPSFVATLATMGTALGLARLASGGTNVPGVPAELMDLMSFRILHLELSVYIAAMVTMAGVVILNFTLFGLYTFAIGSSVESARRAGIRVERHLVAIYMLMGTIAGIVAVIDLGRFGVASINAHSTDSLQAIAGAVIGGASLFGGRGTIFGAVLGAFIPALLRNGFIILGLQAYWQEVAIGIVLALAVYFDQWRRQKMLSIHSRIGDQEASLPVVPNRVPAPEQKG